MIKNINFKANIQANAQDLVVSNQKDVKESVAYNIDVPADSATYTTVHKIGGMTRKCTNLLNLPQTIEKTQNAYNCDLFTGSAGLDSPVDVATINTLPYLEAGDYYFNYEMIGATVDSVNIVQVNSDGSTATILINTKGKFTVQSGTRVSVRVYTNEVVTIKNIMLNAGSTALPYEPYFEGLRSAKVTEVESVGVNKLGGIALANRIKEVDSGAVINTVDKTVLYSAGGISGKVLFTSFKPNTQYTFIFKGYSDKKFLNLIVRYTDGTQGDFDKFDESNEVGTIRFVSNKSKSIKSLDGIWFDGNTVLYYDECGIFEGDVQVQDFKPYFKHTLPIPVEVRGSMNLIPYPYDFGTSTTDEGVTFVANSDGSVTVNGTAERSIYMKIADVSALDGGCFISGCPAGGSDNTYRIIVDENNVGIASDYGSGAKFSAHNSNTYSVIIYIPQGSAVSNLVFKPMLNEGTTALPYEPYSTEKGLDGYGLGVSDTVYNYIDLEKKQFVKRCASVDMGTLNWDYEILYARFVGTMPSDYKIPTTYEERFALLSAIYATSSSPVSGNYEDMTIIGYDSDNKIYVNNASYTDAASFKSAMSGVMLLYALATPEVIDLSDLISADSFIGVQGDGTLTFKNAYEYAVPSEVTLYEGDNEIIGSKTFVGDLIGEAGRAKKATMAVYDESGNKIDETYLPKSGGTMSGHITLPHGTYIRNNYGNPILEYRGSGSDNSGTRVGDYKDRMVLLTSGDDLWHFNYAAGGDGKILDTLNYSSYALPLSGGTLGGQVVANASAVATLETKQVRNIYAGTSDLTAGSSALPTGDIYIVYE